MPALSPTAAVWARFLGVIALLGLLVFIAMSLRAVLTPIIAALAVAYVLNPLLTWLERNGVPRVVAVAVILLVGIGVATLTLALLITAGVSQVIQFGQNVPQYAQNLLIRLSALFPDLASEGRARQELVNILRQHGASIGPLLGQYLGNTVSSTTYWISFTVLMPMYVFFFSWRFNDIVRTTYEHLPYRSRPTVARIVSTIDNAMASFFRGRVVVCMIIALLTGVGWLIVGVPYSLPLGAAAGMLNLVPFLSVLALPPALLFSFLEASEAQANWVWPVILTMAVYMSVQAIESFLLTPVVEARSSGLHPVTTVVALLIGAQLAGLLGMLLAIPIASTLKSLGREYLLPEIRRLASPPAAPECTLAPSNVEPAAAERIQTP